MSENKNWLWSLDVQRELMRFLATEKVVSESNSLKDLEEAILIGPPVDQYTDEERRDYRVWHRLAKLKSSGFPLSGMATQKMNSLAQSYLWRLDESDRDEFPVFWSAGWRTRERQVNIPTDIDQLCLYLKEFQDSTWYEDNWSTFCSENIALSFDALKCLGNEGCWPIQRWDTAINSWTSSDSNEQFNTITPVFKDMPDAVFSDIALPISRWLRATAKKEQECDDFFWLCDRMLALPIQESAVSNTDSLTAAINHPAGNTAEALMVSWFNKFKNTQIKLKGIYKKYFTKLCKTNVHHYVFAQAILCLNTQLFYKVDVEWARKKLLPLFNWSGREDAAKFAWCGFLHSPRLTPDIASDIKNQLLRTVDHCNLLGRYEENYISLMTYIALDPEDIFTNAELKNIFQLLSENGRIHTLDTIWSELTSDENFASEYWENRVKLFFRDIWPKDGQYNTLNVSERIARICIAARGKFPDAVAQLTPWLRPLNDLNFIIYQLLSQRNDSNARINICKDFPQEMFVFLNKIIDSNTPWGANNEMEKILLCLEEYEPSLTGTPQFKALKERVCKN